MTQDIYREEFADIYKNPALRGKLSGPSSSASSTNPMCGDELEVLLKIDEGVVKDARFEGSACAVSVFSAELLLENVIGRRLDEIKKMRKEDLLGLLGLNLSTSRVKCALLALDTLQKAVENYEKTYEKPGE